MGFSGTGLRYLSVYSRVWLADLCLYLPYSTTISKTVLIIACLWVSECVLTCLFLKAVRYRENPLFNFLKSMTGNLRLLPYCLLEPWLGLFFPPGVSGHRLEFWTVHDPPGIIASLSVQLHQTHEREGRQQPRQPGEPWFQSFWHLAGANVLSTRNHVQNPASAVEA